jgi:hypothetical protein
MLGPSAEAAASMITWLLIVVIVGIIVVARWVLR